MAEVLLAVLAVLVPASWGSVLWMLTRMDRRQDAFEGRLAEMRRELAGKVNRDEFLAFRAEVADGLSQVRSDIGALRSDITQLALAIGARPQASEG